MPAGDGTGPRWKGTGMGCGRRGLGFWAGPGGMPGYRSPGPGMGCGMGRGRGGGAGWAGGGGLATGLRACWRNMFHATGLPRWARGGGGHFAAQPGVGRMTGEDPAGNRA